MRRRLPSPRSVRPHSGGHPGQTGVVIGVRVWDLADTYARASRVRGSGDRPVRGLGNRSWQSAITRGWDRPIRIRWMPPLVVHRRGCAPTTRGPQHHIRRWRPLCCRDPTHRISVGDQSPRRVKPNASGVPGDPRRLHRCRTTSGITRCPISERGDRTCLPKRWAGQRHRCHLRRRPCHIHGQISRRDLRQQRRRHLGGDTIIR